ncbi:MAG: NrdH-redoxin [Actinobacteria bacterium]|nr:NrdH-redoxin [Actinomycetota bacterium]
MTTFSNAVLTVYSTEFCGDCIRSKRFLDANGVQYQEIDIAHDDAAAALVMKINNGMQSVPVITFPDGTHLTEPSDLVLKEKLKELSII